MSIVAIAGGGGPVNLVSLGAMHSQRNWLLLPKCPHGHGTMTPERWRWMLRFPLFFGVLYWIALAYLLLTSVAMAVVAFENSGIGFWLLMGSAVLTVAFLATAWFTEKFRCSVCGEHRARWSLLSYGSRHGA